MTGRTITITLTAAAAIGAALTALAIFDDLDPAAIALATGLALLLGTGLAINVYLNTRRNASLRRLVKKCTEPNKKALSHMYELGDAEGYRRGRRVAKPVVIEFKPNDEQG